MKRGKPAVLHAAGFSFTGCSASGLGLVLKKNTIDCIMANRDRLTPCFAVTSAEEGAAGPLAALFDLSRWGI